MESYARTPKQIGEVLRNVRKEQNLTQGELGKKSGLWQETISNIENGASGAKIDSICTLLAALDLELKIIPRRKSKISDIGEIF